MFCHWFGWIAAVFCLLLLAKFIGRISKNKTLNTGLRNIHKPLGIAVIVIGAVHGTAAFLKSPQEVGAIVSGLVLWVLIAALALTYFLRRKLKAKWFRLHRVLSVILIAALAAHIILSV